MESDELKALDAEVQAMLARLADQAEVAPPTVEWSSGTSPFFDVRWGPELSPILRIDAWWFEAVDGVHLCVCGHPNLIHGEVCDWDGCSCDSFSYDRDANDDLVMKSLEAILAHEIAHLVQNRDPDAPTDNHEVEFDADAIGARLLNSPVQMARALSLTRFVDRDSETHPSPEARVSRLLPAS